MPPALSTPRAVVLCGATVPPNSCALFAGRGLCIGGCTCVLGVDTPDFTDDNGSDGYVDRLCMCPALKQVHPRPTLLSLTLLAFLPRAASQFTCSRYVETFSAEVEGDGGDAGFFEGGGASSDMRGDVDQGGGIRSQVCCHADFSGEPDDDDTAQEDVDEAKGETEVDRRMYAILLAPCGCAVRADNAFRWVLGVSAGSGAASTTHGWRRSVPPVTPRCVLAKRQPPRPSATTTRPRRRCARLS